MTGLNIGRKALYKYFGKRKDMRDVTEKQRGKSTRKDYFTRFVRIPRLISNTLICTIVEFKEILRL